MGLNGEDEEEMKVFELYSLLKRGERFYFLRQTVGFVVS